MSASSENQKLAILVGGGPAPGINSVIASATIEAVNCGLHVIGLRDGFRWLVQGDTTHAVELGIRDVSRIHFTGGSILRTSRTNPARDEGGPERAVTALTKLGVRYLLCIGGDDTTFGASKIAEASRGRIGVATRTQDYRQRLAAALTTRPPSVSRPRAPWEPGIVESLMEDARTTGRWYLAISMGRKSGALALGMCKSAGATLAVIPEEFHAPTLELELVVDTIVGSIIKRLAWGRDDGVALIAEGIAEKLDPGTLAHLDSGLSGRDAYGHVHLADVPIGSLLREQIIKALAELGVNATVVSKDIGYELRCAKPLPFDVEYTRTLGYGAVRYLLGGGSGALIAISGGRVTPVSLEDLKDPETGRVRTRMVEVDTESYHVARSYMIRLEMPDFEEPTLSSLAGQTKLSAQEFKQRFLPVVEATAPVAGHPSAVK